MPIITTADLKAHLGVTLDTDDDFIDGKIEAAEASLEQLLGYTFAAQFPDTETVDFPDTVPGDLKEAIRQLAAHYYENREASVVGVSVSVLPLGVRDIVNNRREWYGSADVE